jgi:hypothetical protein
MLSRIRSLLGLTCALAASACSASTIRPSLSANTVSECPGGSIHGARDIYRYKDCSSVAGGLRIEGSELASLDALANLTRVSGALVISHNAQLTELAGLQNLRSVGSLEIRSNPELSSLAGLESLEVSRRVSIVENPSLRHLNGLTRLTRLSSLVLSKNGLYRTSGLEGLREVGDLVIAQNRYLISLAGLKNLTRARSVSIRENRRICAQSGLLPQLTQVDGRLELNANSGLFAADLLRLTARAKQGDLE